ncbi:MAG TPA: DUF5684 domain-containing protein [Terriglobales bacterium]
MRTRLRQLSSFAVGLLAVVTLSGAAFALDSDNAAAAAIGSTILLFIFGLALVGYVYMALALQTIAQKTSTRNAWLAWIPIANIILMLDIAKKPMWWILLFFIPLVNVIVAVIVWMGIAKARNKPDWWGILTIVPVANIVVPGYLAWAD